MQNISIWLVGLSCTFVACSGDVDHHGRTPLVEVSGMYLYREDVNKILPAAVSATDSATFVSNYIRNWVEDALLYQKAEQNVSDNQRIQRLVENYRRALVMHEYQQKLIGQRLEKKIPEPDLQAFYESNKELFKVDETLIKGLFIKVPLNVPEINKVRRWYRSKEQETVDKLEKLSLGKAADYMYFYERWIPAATVLAKVPLQTGNNDRYLTKNRHIELRDSVYAYFLNIDDILLGGEAKPFEAAREDVKKMMLNLKQADYMRSVKSDLYQQASEDEDIKYYYDNSTTDEKTN